MKITYWSHSCFLVETSTHRLVIDPFLKGNELAKIKPEDVRCDFILVSHGHEDHLGDSIEIAKRNGATIIAAYETAVFCEKNGAQVHPMQHGGAWQFPFGRVKLTIAHHSSSRATRDGFLYLGNPAGIVITAEGRTLYHAGDTALFLDMKLIGELNRIDLAMVPIGDNFTMGPEDAALAVEFVRARLALPMHYNTFELIKVDPQRFVDACAARGHEARVLEIGGSLEL
jgi:L-ascorbate metabolism protein UlaG (beta-lactamase superfamily)